METGLHTSKLVGRYEILREIGRGGMAVVFLARQTDLERFVALKELNASDPSDPSFAQRFVREAKLAGSLSHPNIVTVYDYFEYDGTPYIAMEYVERGSLRPYIGRLTLAQIGGVLEGLLAGLAHGEMHGIVHRDLKPENLMVTTEGRVKIADFGIAKATNRIQSSAFLTATGTTVGTPTYMAPEQAMAQEIGPATDLYSVGCMAFELFTGKPPFHETEAPMALLLRHINEPIPLVTTVNPGVDPRISDWIERLLVKDPAQRTQSAAAAWDDFEEIVISLLGPRWRRDARLGEIGEELEPAMPLTPAPFESAQAAVPTASDEFQTFSWRGRTSESTRDSDADVAPPPAPLGGGVREAAPAEGAMAEERAAAAKSNLRGAAPVTAEESAKFVTYMAPPPSPREPEPRETPVEPAAVTPPPAPIAPPPEPAPSPPAAVAPLPADLAPTIVPKTPLPPAAEPWPPTTPPPPAPARPAPPVGRPGRRLLIPLVALGILTAVLVAVLLGGDGGGPERKTATPGAQQTLTSGSLSLRMPIGWKQVGQVPATPGFTLRDAVAATPTSGSGAILLALAGDGSARPSLLPAGIKAPKPAIVRLGTLSAYRYNGVGTRRLTVLVAPTSAGVATIALLRPTPDALRAATTLTIQHARTFPVGPSRTYARTLNRSLGTLNESLTSGRRALRRVDTPKAQASAASAIATAYRHAAVLLSRLELSPADRGLNARLVSALHAGRRGYVSLAVAAWAGRRTAYGTAAKRVAGAERSVTAAQRELFRAGYASLLTARVAPAAVPAMARTRSTSTTTKPTATPSAQPQPTTTAAPRPPTQPAPAPPRSTPPPVVRGGGDEEG